MSKINKLIIIIICAVLLLFVFELFYFYNQRKQPALSQASTVNITNISRDLTGMVGYLYKEGAAGILSNLSLTMTYQGTLTKLDFSDKPLTTSRSKIPVNVAMTLSLTLKDGNKREFYLMKPELDKVSYYLMGKDGVLTVIDNKSIKEGDKISYTTTINLLKPPSDNLLEAKIIKYQ